MLRGLIDLASMICGAVGQRAAQVAIAVTPHVCELFLRGSVNPYGVGVTVLQIYGSRMIGCWFACSMLASVMSGDSPRAPRYLPPLLIVLSVTTTKILFFSLLCSRALIK